MSEMMHVPDGWEVKKLSNIGEIITGNTPPTDNEEYYKGNISFIGPVDFNGQKYILETEKTVSKEGLKYSREIPKNTIMTVCIGSTIGKVALSTETSCTNQQINSLVCDKEYVSEYIYYSMNLFLQRQLDIEAGLQAVPIVNKSSFSNLTLYVPKEKKEQEKIAKILSTLDKSIEATNRLIEKEKNIKKALMQELLTNGIDKDGHIRTRATHTYKESELGLIPDEWKVDFIENHTKIITGDKDTQDRLDDGIYPFYVRSQTIERINTYSFDGEAVLTAGDGVGVGKVFHFVNKKFDFHQRVYCIHDFSEKLDSAFFFEYFRTYFIEQVNKYSAKGSVDSVRFDMIALMNIPLPPVEEQKQIAKILTTQDKKIETEEANLAKLKELKKGLINDLLSGKVRVKV